MNEPTTQTEKVLSEVHEERKRQHLKWGEQNFPSLKNIIPIPGNSIASAVAMVNSYGLPSEFTAKKECNIAMEKGTCTFAHIAVEELCEVISCLDDEKQMRKELIQLAAVAVQWVETIDRKNSDKGLSLHFDPETLKELHNHFSVTTPLHVSFDFNLADSETTDAIIMPCDFCTGIGNDGKSDCLYCKGTGKKLILPNS